MAMTEPDVHHKRLVDLGFWDQMAIAQWAAPKVYLSVVYLSAISVMLAALVVILVLGTL